MEAPQDERAHPTALVLILVVWALVPATALPLEAQAGWVDGGDVLLSVREPFPHVEPPVAVDPDDRSPLDGSPG